MIADDPIPWDQLPTPDWVLPGPGTISDRGEGEDREIYWALLLLTSGIENRELSGTGSYPCYHCGQGDDTVICFLCNRNICPGCSDYFEHNTEICRLGER